MKKKIFYIIRESDLFGSNRSLLNLIDGLNKEKYEIVGVACSYNGVIVHEFQHRHIPVYFIPFDYSVYPHKNFIHLCCWIFHFCIYETYALLKLIRILKTLKPDIIHSNVSVITIGIISSLFLPTKHVWHIREYQDLDFHMHYFPSQSYFKFLLKHSYSICITKGIQNHFNLQNEKKNKVIYNGIMPQKYCCYEAHKKDYYLYAGRIEKNKGIEDLLNVYNQFCKKHSFNTELWIAGTGNPKYVNKLKSFCENNHISQRVKFLGIRNDCFELMKYSKALIVPSISEAFGRVTAEGLFAGCIVIGRNTAGTKEILSEKNIGLLFNNNQELLHYLTDVEIKTPAYFKDMVIKGQQIASTLYSNEASAENIMCFYNQILKC